MIGFRDAFGIRPLVIGSRPSPNTPGKKDWMMASESVALDQRGFTDDMRDILPGEAVIIPKATNTPIFHQVQEQIKYAPDIFEYVYFARPDSIIDGISVQESRENMGYKLADTIRQRLTKAELAEIDAIIPIPETAITSAACVAERLNKPFCQGFVKNRYVFRTFISKLSVLILESHANAETASARPKDARKERPAQAQPHESQIRRQKRPPGR